MKKILSICWIKKPKAHYLLPNLAGFKTKTHRTNNSDGSHTYSDSERYSLVTYAHALINYILLLI